MVEKQRKPEERDTPEEVDALDGMDSEQTGTLCQRQLISRLHHYLLRDKNFTVTDMDSDILASKLATNRTTLYRALKAVTGKTLHIQFMRIEEAKRMLVTPHQGIPRQGSRTAAIRSSKQSLYLEESIKPLKR